ncbi:MAG: cupin domain-containing protein [Hyphomicrobium sp.]
MADTQCSGTPELTADDVIALLGLAPHPEGGYFRETFCDSGATTGPRGERAFSTAIYFLLRQGEASRWHRVDAAEVWHHYAGAPLRLEIAPPKGPATANRLGGRLADGERPQVVVPAGDWQRAQSLGAWTLVGCTVAPGFDFAGFEIADAGFEPGA